MTTTPLCPMCTTPLSRTNRILRRFALLMCHKCDLVHIESDDVKDPMAWVDSSRPGLSSRLRARLVEVEALRTAALAAHAEALEFERRREFEAMYGQVEGDPRWTVM